MLELSEVKSVCLRTSLILEFSSFFLYKSPALISCYALLKTIIDWWLTLQQKYFMIQQIIHWFGLGWLNSGMEPAQWMALYRTSSSAPLCALICVYGRIDNCNYIWGILYRLEDLEMNDFYAEFVLVYVWSEWVWVYCALKFSDRGSLIKEWPMLRTC